MDPAKLDLIRSLVQLLLTSLILGVGVWALQSYIKNRTKLPRAKEGFLTLEDLKIHCNGVQETCLRNLSGKMETLANVVEERLGRGDKLFDDHAERLKEIEQDLFRSTEKLKNFEDGFCEKVVAVMRKIQKEEKQ